MVITMKKNNVQKHSLELVEYVFITVNLLVVFKILVLSIDINYFREQGGSLSVLGEYIKFSQMLFENITNPIVKPFKAFFPSSMDAELANILAPVLAIILIFFLNIAYKLALPYVLDYLRRESD